MQQALLYTGDPPMGMTEALVLTPDHPGLTHIDAHAHMPVDGLVYPGRPLTEAVTAAGVVTVRRPRSRPPWSRAAGCTSSPETP